MTFDALDDDTARRFRFMPALGALGSALMHAGVALALLPAMLSQKHAPFTEQLASITLELPTPPNAASTVAAAEPTHDPPVGPMAEIAGSPVPAQGETPLAVATPAPNDRDIVSSLPSAEPPPPVFAREFGAVRLPDVPDTSLEEALTPVTAPPTVSSRDWSANSPSVAAAAPRLQSPPPQRQPSPQAAPRRTSRPQGAEGTARTAAKAPSSINQTAMDDRHRRVQQDYLMQVVNKLSRARFQDNSREASSQGMLVARLTVARDGRLLDLAITRSSGFPGHDRSIAETIRRTAPFPPLPAEIGVEPYTFTVPIGYALDR
ncbi:MAG: TonB family protein [Reyranella sp.]|uniref:TonB family protein n=1 Tax=Reyranella sp. TaxID=1929291 RepID=UPI003D12644E